MPFMKGRAALRRTIDWLEKGQILFRDNVKSVTFNYVPDEVHYPHHAGLHKFIFWHLPQLKYRNPDVQLVTFKMMTPTPWIKAYMDDETNLLIDCDGRTREEIHDHMKTVLGKTSALLELERAQEESIKANPANFGWDFPRQCICEVPGQIACPLYETLPKVMRGKYRAKVRHGDTTFEDIMAEDIIPERKECKNEMQRYIWKESNKTY